MQIILVLTFASFTYSCASPLISPVERPNSEYPWLRTYFIDPDHGNDANDGLSQANAKASLSFLKTAFPPPASYIAIKRGTVLRLGETVYLRGGKSSGWLGYGAYGEPDEKMPVLLGSLPLNRTEWIQEASQQSIWKLDWSRGIDKAEGREEYGPEQGPGNLWFFDSDEPEARMLGWGWRKASSQALQTKGDWYYDAANKAILLFWPENQAPDHTEAAVNRRMLDFRGQSYIVVEDLDLRYGGNYLIAGHSAAHIAFRNLDLSYSGGGTKNGEYIRLGNGIEFNGDVEDVSVSACRIHQLYDTGFDQQNVGGAKVRQRNLSFTNNLVSYAGLASFELWARPRDSLIENLTLSGNTFIHAGRGWGYEQHDAPGMAKVGGDIVIFENDADIVNVSIKQNVFANARTIFLCEYKDHQERTKDLLSALEMDMNLWYSPQAAAVLFNGSISADGTSILGNSRVYETLAEWQAATELEVKGKDLTSVSLGSFAELDFSNASDDTEQASAWIWSLAQDSNKRPQLSASFALSGDYTRGASSPSASWGYKGRN